MLAKHFYFCGCNEEDISKVCLDKQYSTHHSYIAIIQLACSTDPSAPLIDLLLSGLPHLCAP